MRWLKKTGLWLLILTALLFVVILTCNWVIIGAAKGKLYDRIAEIPANRVGLLLGTSPRLRGGKPNLYFHYRIEAAAALYHAGKISRILVSGDNRKRNYNEPIEMQKALIAQGVPDSVIVLDYAGFRTLDSVVRSRKVFGQDSLTIISQAFHNERALYLARQNHIQAIGFNARDVNVYSGFKTNARELLARVKMFIDLSLGKGPKHLGDPIPVI